MRTLLPLIATCAVLTACRLEPPTSPPLLLPGSWTLSGVVKDQNARPLSNARVEITRGAERPRWTTTDPSGSYFIEWVGGEVQVRVTKFGYEAAQGSATVTANRGLNFELRMLPELYVLSGVVRDQSGRPVPNARVEVTRGFRGEGPDPWALTKQDGQYSIEWVGRDFEVRVDKPGYDIVQRSAVIDADARMNFDITFRLSVLKDTLEIGATIRSTTDQPPCDPARWDALAPCRRFYFRPSANGRLDITIRFGLVPMDVLVLVFGADDYIEYSDEESGLMTLSVDLAAGELYEIRLNSYYQRETFDLEASFAPF